MTSVLGPGGIGMTVNRRKPEAAGIRALFQVQWDHITSLLDQRLAHREANKRRATREIEAVEAVVNGTDGRMRLVSWYKTRLRRAVQELLSYVEGMVARVPEPIPISRERFFVDPRVSTFFVNRDAIGEVFSRSHELQSFFRNPRFSDVPEVWAILFMNKVEREVLGLGMHGDVLTRDIRQTSISFTNHRIVQPCASEEAVRSALEQVLFDNYVQFVNYRLTRLRAGQTTNRANPSGEQVGNEAIDLKNPAVYLEELSRILERPDDLLRLDAGVVRMNRVGIKVEEGSSEVAHDIRLYELGYGERGRQVLTLVTYPRSQMLSQEDIWRRVGMF